MLGIKSTIPVYFAIIEVEDTVGGFHFDV
jgi:hypothetical protein